MLFSCISALVMAFIISYMMVLPYTASLSCLFSAFSEFMPMSVVISEDMSTDSA